MRYILPLFLIIVWLGACQSSSNSTSTTEETNPPIATLAATAIPIAGITATSRPLPPTDSPPPALPIPEPTSTSEPQFVMPFGDRTTLAGLPCTTPARPYPTATLVLDPNATVEPEGSSQAGNLEELPAPVEATLPTTAEAGALATVEPTEPSQPVASVDAVFIQDKYAYINTGSNLAILDLSNPTEPLPVGSAALPAHTSATAIYVLDHYAYVMAEGLRIFDVANPAHPTEIGCYQPPFRAWTGYITMTSPSPPPHRTMDVVVQQGKTGRTYAYVAANTAGLRIVDVSNPATPLEIGVYEFEQPAQATGIAVAGDVAYLATGQGGLRVMDISDPTRPVEIGALAEHNESWDVAVAGDRLYVVEGYCSSHDGCDFGRLRLIDVSNPGNLHQIEQTSLPYSQVVALAGENIYVATRYSLSIFRSADLISFWPSDSYITDIALKDDIIYLATGGPELKILKVRR